MHGFPVEGKHLKVQLKKGDEQQLAPPTQPSLGGPTLAGLLEATTGLPHQPPPPPGLPPGFVQHQPAPPPGLPPGLAAARATGLHGMDGTFAAARPGPY
mmetsp:Transcript_24357/g.75821  ORF Transcript_24357/g.75821 Transcript_24357/m.75821 type:complete len:99 (+) Transcript_24357:837-1133(+)